MRRGVSYVIEARNPDGSLDLKGTQPEEHFGLGAITGLDPDRIARLVYSYVPDATMNGMEGPTVWVKLVNPRYVARVKYW